jgi:hypothetical protein
LTVAVDHAAAAPECGGCLTQRKRILGGAADAIGVFVLLALFSGHKEPKSIETARTFNPMSVAALGCVALILALSFLMPKRDLA